MASEAPSSFNQHIFFDANSVYYGTDDGYQDGSFGEFDRFETLYESVAPARRRGIHFVSAVGGLYGLNLMACWRPSEITFFDINPHAVAYFEVIRRVFAASASKREFLERLTHQDYDVEGEAAETIRENLALKQRGDLPRSRGSSYKRSLEVSWQYALERFDLTRGLLADVPVHTRVGGIEGADLGAFLREADNVWMYCSNIAEFTYAKLRFDRPANAVLVSIVYPGQVDVLDLAAFGDRPVEVDFQIPLGASAVGESVRPEESPDANGDELGQALAAICREQLALAANERILDVGCGWGRLAIALGPHLEAAGEYEGFDPCREHVVWAQRNVAPANLRFTFHIANLRNALYNPGGSLAPAGFRFPYADDHFDLVVANSVFPFLAPEEIERYVAEAARVLKPGGRLLTSFFLLAEDAPPVACAGAEPAAFRYADGPAVTTSPRGHGLAAHREGWVRELLSRHALQPIDVARGTWRGRGGGVLCEDAVTSRLEARQ